MTRRRVQLERAFILHSYPYKETSLVVEAFTRHHGRVGLLARGARRPRSAIRGSLLAFHPLRLSWTASAELGTLAGVEWTGGQHALAGLSLMCGFYVNELLMRLLPREDAHEHLFDAYAELVTRLADGAEQAVLLRGFELRLLTELGYAPPLDRDAASGNPVQPGTRYAYVPERGPLAFSGGEVEGGSEDLVVEGQTLLDMSRNDYGRPATREEARRLMRRLIAVRLAGQALHTREMLRELQDL
jgi:DNA repair protein RecO (recombination protein O)